MANFSLEESASMSKVNTDVPETARQSLANLSLSEPTSTSNINTEDPGKTVQTICPQPAKTPTQTSLCPKCTTLNLPALFAQESTPDETNMGPISDYRDPSCTFCTLIWDAIREHWGDADPAIIGKYPNNKVVQPNLFAMSQDWCSWEDDDEDEDDSDSEEEDSEEEDGEEEDSDEEESDNEDEEKDSSDPKPWYIRLLLAIENRRPPGYQLKRRPRHTDNDSRFIIASLELLPTDEDVENRIRRTIKPTFDLDLLSSWLQDCHNHEPCKIRQYDDKLFEGGFRLIDVFEERLEMKTERCEYFALSYVWGAMDPFVLRTTKINLDELCQPHALKAGSSRTDGQRICRTIADAMALCRGVGQRYLWVDSFCIVQDDPDDKAKLIHAMDRVYEEASLTIIAAHGTDADAGLAGISTREKLDREEKSYKISTDSGDLNIAYARNSLAEQLRNSHWNTRGWTFQENALSERRLYFTSSEVFFTCPFRRTREGYELEGLNPGATAEWAPPLWKDYRIPDDFSKGWETDSDGSGISFYSIGVWDPDEDLNAIPARNYGKEMWKGKGSWTRYMEESFENAVWDYTRKDLTYEGDVLNAFTGIYQRFSHQETIQDPGIMATHGIPIFFLPKALAWYIPNEAIAAARKREQVAGMELASWSWASWIAPIDYDSPGLSRIQFSWFNQDSEKRFYFVCEFHLAYKDGDGVVKAHFQRKETEPDVTDGEETNDEEKDGKKKEGEGKGRKERKEKEGDEKEGKETDTKEKDGNQQDGKEQDGEEKDEEEKDEGEKDEEEKDEEEDEHEDSEEEEDKEPLTPSHFLSFLPPKPSRPPPAPSTLPGTLSFLAPCIAFPSGFQREDFEESLPDFMLETYPKGEWMVCFEGADEFCLFVQFDSDDEVFDEIVVLYYDGNYVALAVRTMEEVDGVKVVKRVGLATLTGLKGYWEKGLGTGQLHLRWKDVCLC